MSSPRRLVVVACLPAWLVIVGVVDLLGVAWLLPPLVLVGTMAVLRVGESLADRLLAAIGLLLGVTMAAGLGLSLWPWRLSPGVLAAVAGGVLLLGVVVTGRRPVLPRPTAPDLSVVVAVALALWTAKPILAASGFADRLAVVIASEDNARHSSWFDVTGRFGSYLFLTDPAELEPYVSGGAGTYPQGWHFTTALLDGFLRAPGSGGTATFDHYVGWLLATQGLLILAVVWLAGVLARVRGVLPAVVAAGTAGLLAIGGEMTRTLFYGSPAQALALALQVILVGVALLSRGGPGRPDHEDGVDPEVSASIGSREPLLVIAAVVVATGFSYYLYLAPAGLAAFAWVWWRRGALRPHRRMVVVTIAASVALASVVPAISLMVSVASGSLASPGNGTALYGALVVLGSLGLVGVLAGGLAALPKWRWWATATLIYLVCALVLGATGSTGYYFQKMLDTVLALLLAGVGGLAGILVTRLRPGPALTRSRVPALAGSVALLGSAALVGGLTPWGTGMFVDPVLRESYWRAWQVGTYRMDGPAATVLRSYQQVPASRGTATIVVDLDVWVGYRSSLFLGSLQSAMGSNEAMMRAPSFVEPDRLREQLALSSGPVRLVATTPEAANFALGLVNESQDYQRRVRLEVLDAPAGH